MAEKVKRVGNDSVLVRLNKTVYDVSGYLDTHPGGPEVLLAASTLGEDVFFLFSSIHLGASRAKALRSLHGLKVDYELASATEEKQESPLLEDLHNLGKFWASRSPHLATLLEAAKLALLWLAAVWLVLRGFAALSGLVLAFFLQQAAFLGHDLGHSSVTGLCGLDSFLGLFVGNAATGISIGWWKKTHNVHHCATNFLDIDLDVQHLPLLCFDLCQKRTVGSGLVRRCLSWQHVYVVPLLLVARAYLYVSSWLFALQSPNGVQETAGLTVYWLWRSYLAASFWAHGNAKAVLTHLTCCLCASGLLHWQILLNHGVCPLFCAVEGQMSSVFLWGPEAWVQQQLQSTVDIDLPKSCDFLFGGLQFQTAHHLYPRVPRVHLRALSEALDMVLKKHGLARKKLSPWQASVKLWRRLRYVALNDS